VIVYDEYGTLVEGTAGAKSLFYVRPGWVVQATQDAELYATPCQVAWVGASPSPGGSHGHPPGS
jgi:hypothetical protein